jgi:hypothetical protein
MNREAVISPPPICRLPPSAQTLLSQLLAGQAVKVMRYRHEATRSAAQTQAVLPPGVLVQKTVSVAFGDRSHTGVLWTGVGDFQISKEAVLLVAGQLGLSRRAARNATINPAWLDPVAAFGMQAGMVSPFLPPPSPGQQAFPISALVVESWPTVWEKTMHVAISLSLYESLILPLRTLRPLLRAYYALAHPAIACLFLAIDGRSWQAETGAGLSLLALEASVGD